MTETDKTLKQLFFDSIEEEDIEKVKACIILGMNANAIKGYKETPALLYALKNYDILELLLSLPGIDVNETDKFGDTAFTLACWNRNLDAVRRLSYVPGIELNIKDEDGDTAAMCAVDDNHVECVKVLR